MKDNKSKIKSQPKSQLKSRSVASRIYQIVFLSVFFLLIEFAGSYYFSMHTSDRITEIYHAHHILDQTETCLKLADNISDTFRDLLSKTNKLDTWEVFKQRIKEINSLLSRIHPEDLPDNITEKISKTHVSLNEIETLGNRVFTLATASPNLDQDEFEKSRFIIEQHKIQLIEHLDKIRVSVNGVIKNSFESAYSKRYLPIVVGLNLAILLSILLGGIGIRLGNHIIRSTKNLMSATLSFSEGHLEYRAPILADDELGVLTRSFNNMAEQVLRANQDLEKTLEELKLKQLQLVQSGKLAALGEMSSGIAHELNNPLLLIKGFNNRIKVAFEKGSATFEKVKPYIQDVDESCERMRKIIQHFRDFSRQADQYFKIININAVVERSFLLLNEQLRLRSIEVVLNLTSAMPEIFGESNRLEQVFINLISNSRDALDDSHAKTVRRIEVSSIVEGDSVVVKFSDNGPGISPEHMDRIFDPFFTTKEVGKGTGLGLSISHSIIKEHQGELSCHSILGQGTDFIIRMPLGKKT